MEKETNTEIKQDKLAKFKKNINSWNEYYKANNANFKADFDFLYEKDGMWTQAEIAQFTFEKRPLYEFNLIHKLNTAIVGEYANTTPTVKVRATAFTDTAQEKVDLLTALLRQESFCSESKEAHAYALLNAITGGYGAFRIEVVRERPGSFNFVEHTKKIMNPLNCFWDSMAEQVNKIDGEFCGEKFSLSKNEFEARYPGAKIPTSADFNTGDIDMWFNEDDVIVVDYYEKTYIKRKYALLSDNSVVLADDAQRVLRKKNRALRELRRAYPANITAYKNIIIEDEEEQIDYKIKHYRLSGVEILEENKWEGKYLPIIFQPCILRRSGQKEKTFSMTHFLKDAQHAYNYVMTEILHRHKLTRYEPYLATPAMVAGHEDDWKNAHLALSVLLYEPDPVAGKPERQTPQEIPQSLFVTLQSIIKTIESITGRYEANLGAPSNETSGVAINARQAAGNLNLKEVFDNATQAIQTGAQIRLDLLPTIYDTTRKVNLMGDNGKVKSQQINSDETNTLDKGFYDVAITVGTSFELQQQIAKQTIAEAFKAVPGFAQIAPDIYAENLDIKNAPKLVDRARKYLMTQIAADEGDKDAQKLLAQQQQQTQQQKQIQQQMLTIQLKSALLDLRAKQTGIQASEEKIKDDSVKATSAQMTSSANLMDAETNRMEAQTKGVIESGRIKAEEDKARMETEREVLKLLAELQKTMGGNVPPNILGGLNG